MRTLWTHYLPELKGIAKKYDLNGLETFLFNPNDVCCGDLNIKDFFWRAVKVNKEEWENIQTSTDKWLIDEVPWAWNRIIMRKKFIEGAYDFEKFDEKCSYYVDLWLVMMAVMLKIVHDSANEEIAMERVVWFMSIWADIRNSIHEARRTYDYSILNNIHFNM